MDQPLESVLHNYWCFKMFICVSADISATDFIHLSINRQQVQRDGSRSKANFVKIQLHIPGHFPPPQYLPRSAHLISSLPLLCQNIPPYLSLYLLLFHSYHMPSSQLSPIFGFPSSVPGRTSSAHPSSTSFAKLFIPGAHYWRWCCGCRWVNTMKEVLLPGP